MAVPEKIKIKIKIDVELSFAHGPWVGKRVLFVFG